jgi:hypothetical protein
MLRVFVVITAVSACFAVFLPTKVYTGDDGRLMVSLSDVNMSLPATNPAQYPFFRDVIGASRFAASKLIAFDELQELLDNSDSSSGPGLLKPADDSCTGRYPPAVPSGLIFHEGRVGSTLAANST